MATTNSLFYADARENPHNCLYPHAADINDDIWLTEALKHDHITAEFENYYDNSTIEDLLEDAVSKSGGYISPEEFDVPAGWDAPVPFPEKSVPAGWDAPVPFPEKSVPAFPTEALPKTIQNFVNAVSESTQTPPDLAACTALGILSICNQGKYVVQPKPGWIEPLNTYIMIVARPSERKSVVLSTMMKPVNSYERAYNASHQAEIIWSETQKSSLEKRKEAAIRKSVKDPDGASKELMKLAAEEAAFEPKHSLELYTDDCTPEKIAMDLAAQNGRFSIVSSEGGVFGTINGRYNADPNMNVWLQGYSGDTIRVDRVGRRPIVINNPALTVILMVQPGVMQSFIGNPAFAGRGLSARFAYSLPESLVGTRKYVTEPVPKEIEREYSTLIDRLLKAESPNDFSCFIEQDNSYDPEFPFENGYSPETGDLPIETSDSLCETDDTPPAILLSEEASALFEKFCNEVELKLNGEYEEIEGWAGKFCGFVARIAGNFCIAEAVEENGCLIQELTVSGKVMENAIKIGRYFVEHAKAAFSYYTDASLDNRCKKLLAKLAERNIKEFTARDIMRIDKQYKSREQLTPVLNKLCDFGYITEKTPESKSKGGRPTVKYLLNPQKCA